MNQLDLEDPSAQRSRLVQLIESSHPQGSTNNSVTIVFDGYPGPWQPNQSSSVKSLFAMQVSADDKIREMVSLSNNRSNIIVVTDDRSVQYSVRALGAKILSVPDFLAKMPGKKAGSKQRKSPQDEPKGKYIPETLQSSITQELEAIWLKKEPKKNKQQP